LGHLFRTTTLIALLALSGCASTADTNATSLSAAFDCLRTSNAAVVSAHRAGSGPGVPENSLIGIRASIAAGVAVLEIDVALSADDVPVLMHDRTLDRTTTGRGPVSGLRLSQLQTYMLRDPSGALSSERVPTLAEALAASNGKAVLMLDIKTGVSDEDPNWQRRYRRVVQEIARSVTSARARQQVAFIAYSAQESAMIHETAPWAMQSVSVSGETTIERYSASGLPARAEPRPLSATGWPVS
jgi:glycerophosphoryl diester phosphodiesterase